MTKALLKNIDYKKVKERRLDNFFFLHKELNEFNELNINLNSINCPMVYPRLIYNEYLRNKLINKKIFIAQYWQNVLKYLSKQSYESYLVKYLLPIPIDQRYYNYSMEKIIDFIKKIIK